MILRSDSTVILLKNDVGKIVINLLTRYCNISRHDILHSIKKNLKHKNLITLKLKT